MDRTIFYPQGGGQPADTGFVRIDGLDKKFVVSDVRSKDGIVSFPKSKFSCLFIFIFWGVCVLSLVLGTGCVNYFPNPWSYYDDVGFSLWFLWESGRGIWAYTREREGCFTVCWWAQAKTELQVKLFFANHMKNLQPFLVMFSFFVVWVEKSNTWFIRVTFSGEHSWFCLCSKGNALLPVFSLFLALFLWIIRHYQVPTLYI